MAQSVITDRKRPYYDLPELGEASCGPASRMVYRGKVAALGSAGSHADAALSLDNAAIPHVRDLPKDGSLSSRPGGMACYLPMFCVARPDFGHICRCSSVPRSGLAAQIHRTGCCL